MQKIIQKSQKIMKKIKISAKNHKKWKKSHFPQQCGIKTE